jgi:hypothetical protein
VGLIAGATLFHAQSGVFPRGIDIGPGGFERILALVVLGNVFFLPQLATDRISIRKLVGARFKVKEQPVFKARVGDSGRYPELPSCLNGITGVPQSLLVLGTLGVEDNPDFVEAIFESSFRFGFALFSFLLRLLNNMLGCRTLIIGDNDDAIRFQLFLDTLEVET